MRVQCENCEGHGQVISDRSLRHGHTHGNDPDREDVDCEQCEGTGERDAVASDLDGMRVRFRWVTGYVSYERRNDTLTLVCEVTECEVVNLKPEDVKCVS